MLLRFATRPEVADDKLLNLGIKDQPGLPEAHLTDAYPTIIILIIQLIQSFQQVLFNSLFIQMQ